MGAVYQLVPGEPLCCAECGRTVTARVNNRRNLPCGCVARLVDPSDVPCCCRCCIDAADALQEALEAEEQALARSGAVPAPAGTFALRWYWVLFVAWLLLVVGLLAGGLSG